MNEAGRVDYQPGPLHYLDMSEKLTLVNSADAAQRIGVSRSTLQRMVNLGQLRPVGKGPGLRGAYLFDAADIDRVADAKGAALT